MTLEARIAWARRQLRRSRGVADGEVRVVVSPYRICPLGAHSDHQHGPVLGMAIDAYTVLAYAPWAEPRLELTSEEFPGGVRVDLRASARARPSGWGAYAHAAAAVLAEQLPGRPRGFQGHLLGTLPGGGLSSSASVLLAYLLALADANGLELSHTRRVELARRAENDFVGVASGILDPVSITAARRDHLLAIDTARATWEAVRLGGALPAYRFLVAFSGVARSLVRTEFNRRVDECHRAARALAKAAGRGEVTLLGELSDAVFEEHLAALPGPERGRARHFFTERRRVRRGIELWKAGDLPAFGGLMNASCESSIRDYETGSPELVRLQAILLETPDVLGARFSGGGFGGCAVALVEPEAADGACASISSRFAAAHPALAGRVRVFSVASEDGARVV